MTNPYGQIFGQISTQMPNTSSMFGPTPTEQKIKELSQQKEAPKKFTKQDLFGDAKKLMDTKGLDSTTALQTTKDYYARKGYVVDGVDLQPVEPQEEKTMLGKLADIGQSIKPFTATDTSGMDTSTIGGAMKKSFFETIVDPLKSLANVPGDAIQLVGQFGDAISKPIETAKTLNDIGQGITDNIVYGILNKITGSEVDATDNAIIVQGITESLGKLAKDPERMKQLLVENPVDVALTVQGGLQAVRSKITNPKLGQAVDNMIEATNPINMLKAEGAIATAPIKGAKNVLFPEQSLEDILLQVSQGTKADLPKFQQALSKVDTKGIKTYEELDTTFGNKIKEIAQKQDTILPTDEVYSLNKLSTTSKGGTVKVNYISKALDDMEALYDRIDDIDNLERINILKSKKKFSIKDINDIAREYNTNFGKKAFNPVTGEAKYTDIGQSFENIRKGVKEVSRSLLPDDTMRVLDSELSSLYDAQRLAGQMAGKVTNLAKKIQKRGLIEKIARATGRAIDIATMGGPRAFLTSFLPSNIGNKVMNSLDIEANLAKNLKKLDKLIKTADSLDDATLASKVTQFIKELEANLDTMGQQAKTKVGEGLDNLADKTGARMKFIDDTKGTGISGKIEATKELIDEARKYKGSDVLFHNTNSTAKDTGKGVFTMDLVDRNILGGKNVEGIVIVPNKIYKAENQYQLYKKLFNKDLEAVFDWDFYDREIYNTLKKQGYDLIEYKNPLVGRGVEKVILDDKIIKKKIPMGNRVEALDATKGKTFEAMKQDKKGF